MKSDINNILVPTDFSENARNAFSFAIKIAGRWNSDITLVHVIQKPVDYTFSDRESEGHQIRHAERQLEDLVYSTKKRKNGQKIDLKISVQIGNSVSSLIDMTESMDYDLVVMGTKGTSGLKKKLFGSMTAQIATHAPIPVLAVPANSSYSGFESITFASDYRSGDWSAFKETLQWAETFNSELSVLHISERREMETDIQFRGFREMISERTPSKHIRFDHVIKKKFLTGVADYLNDHPVSMLVLVRYPHSYLETLLAEDHTRQMANYTKIPLLVLRGEEVPAQMH